MTTATQLDPANLDRRRYRKILWFFGGAIARVIWWDLLLARIFLFRARVRGSRPTRFRQLARRFRDLAVEMGGVMIKLGQFFSSRVDVLPPEITEELAGLQDEVPPVPMVEVQAVLAAELDDVSRHFDLFETEPLAAASLGQAHRARLVAPSGAPDGLPEGAPSGVPEGPTVIVKVQRPNIEDTVRTDLAALNVVARWVMRYPPIRRRADVPALMDEFAATLWEELDYELEADNAEHFGRLFADDPNVVVPSVYREHSTGRVLVLQDVTGIKITDFEALDRAGIQRSQVAMRLLDAYFRMIFKEGFFHADPHPGNLFVLPVLGRAGSDGRPFRLAFVDFGMVGHIEELMGENLRTVLVSVTQRDARSLTEAYDDLGFFLPNADLERITEAQARVLDEIWGRNLLELSNPDPREVQELGREFRDLLFEFPFQVPRDFIYLGRAMGMLSGLTSQLDPTINPWRLVERYGREIIRSREQRDFSLQTLLALVRPIVALPGQAQRVLAAAEAGRLRVQSQPDRQQLRRLDRLERQVTRNTWTVIVAALLVSGTLLYLNGSIALGVSAWVLAAVLFAWRSI